MLKLLVTTVLATAIVSRAQPPAASTPPEGSNWQHVQALPLGTSIHVKAQHKSVSCALKSVEADSVTCLHGTEITFQRADIKSITIPRRGASTLVMAGVGAGVGLATVKIVSATVFGGGYNKTGGAKGAVWAGGAGAGAIIFGAIGAATHPIHSTIYKAP